MAGVEEGAAPGLGVGDPLEFTVESLHVVRDAESVKEEELQGLRLQMRQKKFHFSVWTLSAKEGVIETDSSAGSHSSSESPSSSTDEPVVPRPALHAYSENVPDGVDFSKHRKSSIVHKVKIGSHIAACGVAVSTNLVKMPRVLSVRWPKCSKCFPKASIRIRNLDQVGDANESARQRANR